MKSLDEYRRFFDKVEKRCVYLLLSLFIIAQWVGVFFPKLNSVLTPQVNIALFSMLLLAIFRLFDFRMNKESIRAHGKSFAEGIDTIIANGATVKSLDLFVHSGSKYLAVLRNKSVHIKRVRLLIVGDQSILNAPTPSLKQDKVSVLQEKVLIINRWKALQREGIVEDLLIRDYAFMPYFHFALVDGKAAVLGLFRPVGDYPGLTTLAMWSICSHDAVGYEMVQSLSSYFDAVFDCLDSAKTAPQQDALGETIDRDGISPNPQSKTKVMSTESVNDQENR